MLTLAELQQYGEVAKYQKPSAEWLAFEPGDFDSDREYKLQLLYWQQGRLNRINYMIRTEQMLDGGLDTAWERMLSLVNAERLEIAGSDLVSHDDLIESNKLHRVQFGAHIRYDRGWREVLDERGQVLERVKL